MKDLKSVFEGILNIGDIEKNMPDIIEIPASWDNNMWAEVISCIKSNNDAIRAMQIRVIMDHIQEELSQIGAIIDPTDNDANYTYKKISKAIADYAKFISTLAERGVDSGNVKDIVEVTSWIIKVAGKTITENNHWEVGCRPKRSKYRDKNAIILYNLEGPKDTEEVYNKLLKSKPRNVESVEYKAIPDDSEWRIKILF